MLKAWYLDPEWKASGEEYYNVTEGGPGWDDYVGTVFSFNRNSYEIPCLIGYGIIGVFCLVVICASLLRLLASFGIHPLEHLGGPGKGLQKHVAQAPTIGKKHSVPWSAFGGVLSFHMPLRGEMILLLLLSLANFIPIVGVYSPYTPNLYYPDDRFTEIGRYLAGRTAILSTTQIAPTILLAGRNNPVTFLTGASFSTCQFWHRWFARWTFVHAVIHSIVWSVLEAKEGAFLTLWEDPYMWYGGLSMAGMGLATFLAMRYLRQKAYEWFVVLHIVFAACALGGLYLHVHLIDYDDYWADFLNFCWAACTFWVFDRVARLARMKWLNFRFFGVESGGARQSRGEISFLAGYEKIIMMRIRLRGRAASLMGDGVGRFVQVWIPRVQPLSSHPFTVLRIERSGEKNEIVHVHLALRVYKGITERLAKRAKQNGGSCELVTLVEGLYGQPVELRRYNNVSLIAGGLGITAMLPYFWQCVQQQRNVSLVWIMREFGAAQLLVDYLDDVEPRKTASADSANDEKLAHKRPKIHLIVSGQAVYGVAASSQINATAAAHEDSNGYLPTLEQRADEADDVREVPLTDHNDPQESQSSSISDGKTPSRDGHLQAELQRAARKHGFDIAITAGQGRPDVCKLIQEDEALQSVDLISAVVACGPPGLCDDTREASRKMGLAYHEELFDW